MKAHTTPKQIKNKQLAEYAAFLRQERLKRPKSALSVSKALGLRVDQLHVLELWQEAELPPEAFRVGLLNKYAEVLQVPPISQRKRYKRPTITHEDHSGKHFILSRIAVGGALSLVTLIVVAYIGWAARSLIARPSLTLLEPRGDGAVSSNSVVVSGRVGAETLVRINGQAVSVGEDKQFSDRVYLRRGENDVTVTAINSLGRRSEITRRLYY